MVIKLPPLGFKLLTDPPTHSVQRTGEKSRCGGVGRGVDTAHRLIPQIMGGAEPS